MRDSVYLALKNLKKEAGSHSPSINLLKQIPELNIKIDACFLSNPYAADLFLSYFTKEILEEGQLADLFSYYPSQNRSLAKLLSNMLSIHAKQIFVANGAIEVIQAVLHRFCGQKLLVVLPSFSPYYEFAEKRMDVLYYHLNKESNFKLDLPQYLEFIHANHVDSAVLINPNNPDGSYLSKLQIEEILENTKHLKCFILDESFVHFAYEDEALSIITNQHLLDKYPHLVIVKSLSKDFGLAGIRAGYALMAVDRVNALLEDGFLWNSNQIVEYFFTLLSRQIFVEQYDEVRKQFIKESIIFYKKLHLIDGIKVYPTMGNFALVELLDQLASDVVTELLVEHGIYLRDCGDKLGLRGEFIRIASRKHDENMQMIHSIQRVLEKKDVACT